MRRFKTREELRQTGWTFQKSITGEYLFEHLKSTANISPEMLKNVHGLSEEVCRADFAQYQYDDEMFTEIEEVKPIVTKDTMLKSILTQEEYRIFLKAKTLEEVYNENYEGAKAIIDELLEANH
jgi:hypothetical protein